MKLTAGIRVKDGEMWAEECLRGLSEFVDEIVMVDDGSTDRTVEICRSFPKVSTVLPWPKTFFDEGLDRNVLLGLVKGTEPDWILMMDIDEVFEDRIAARIDELTHQDEYVVWGFHMLHFWHGKTQYRMDGKWGKETLHHVHTRLFRNQPSLRYPFQPIHGAHVLGMQGPGGLSDVKIRHYGYSFPVKVREKYDAYRRIDSKGDYEHLIDESDLILVDYEEPATVRSR
ncbi:MAG TPA: glycosyltransferase [Armatimonadota bacterium]|nr:glycosyltransferase [Armatimonadota bacterium]